jgi:hypothetical protein
MLSKPYLAKCGQRTVIPKSHPTCGSPEEWLSNEMLAQHNLKGLGFDFFVNWSTNPNSITPEIWIKRILLDNFSYEEVINNQSEIILNEFGASYLNILKAFSASSGLISQFLIFKDTLNWGHDESELLIVSFVNAEIDDFTSTSELITFQVLKKRIITNSGGPIRIGSKGLVYGTSNLECYLSTTNSLYPGDVDFIILDAENKPLCILEFKKHNLDTAITLQKFSNYYPSPDGRKYNRLAILKEYLSEINPNIPLIIIYYPTNANFTDGRMELLQGGVGSLSARAASNFALPVSSSCEEAAKVIRKLLDLIDFHNSWPAIVG